MKLKRSDVHSEEAFGHLLLSEMYFASEGGRKQTALI